MKKLAYFYIAAVFLFSAVLVTNSFAFSHEKDNWEYKGVTVSAYDPNVKHYTWETARAPDGPWDKIALHRYVRQPHNWDEDPYRPSPDPRKVLFIIPGTWDRGQEKGSDPNISETWFFAANGYDVYSMDFRTSYIPNLSYGQFQEFGLGDALKATTDWTYAVFREDIKACVDLSKDISRARKLFLAGRSRGGWQMWMYAAKYWNQDLKGLISLDGGGPYVLVDTNTGKQWSLAQFLGTIAAFKLGGLPSPYNVFLTEVGGYEQAQFAGAVPFAKTAVGYDLAAHAPLPYGPPPDGSAIETVSDLVAYGLYYVWGPGVVTNYYTPYPGGAGETYMDREVAVGIAANFTRYWPTVQNLETGALTNYANNPYLDYDDTQQVHLPILHFGSAFGCHIMKDCLNLQSPVGSGQSVAARTASTDVTSVIRVDYGHLDIFAGTHALQDVNQPMLKWMNDRLK